MFKSQSIANSKGIFRNEAQPEHSFFFKASGVTNYILKGRSIS
jgi:hypothetical protein